MGEWVEIELGKLGKTFSGLSGKSKEDFGSGKPYIPYLNIFSNSRVNPNALELVQITPQERQNRVQYGDIFFTTSSETVEEVGMTSVLLNDLGEVYLNSFCFGFRLFDFDTLLPEFAVYLLRSERIRRQISFNGQGSTRYNISKLQLLKNVVLRIPNKPEQTVIANILTTIDQAIEKTEQLIAKYERIKTGLMQDLLTRGIDEQGNIRSEETHEFKDSPLGRIPKEWEVVNIGSISEHIGSGVTPKGGNSVYQSSGIMLIRSQNVYPNGFKLDDVAYISEDINNAMLRSEVYKYDVLLNITGASIGRCTYVPENFPRANVNQHVCAIRLFGKNFSKAVFLSEFLNSKSGQNQIFKYNAGSNREGLNYSQIREIEISIPKADDEFERISSFLNAHTETMKSLKSEYNKYFALKKALMQDLLTGKVCVDALMKNQNEIIYPT